jgi:hypothetical protein
MRRRRRSGWELFIVFDLRNYNIMVMCVALCFSGPVVLF